MNAVSPPIPLIPENAPFSPAQRAWLNGFLAGLYGGATSSGLSIGTPPEPEPEDLPWHDPTLELDERMTLAEGKPLKDRLMAAMGQLDCGQCGYLCRSYADALAEGREATTSLCVPGGKPTSRTVKAFSPRGASPRRGDRSRRADRACAAASRPHPCAVLTAERLTGPGSSKDVRHVVIDLADPA